MQYSVLKILFTLVMMKIENYSFGSHYSTLRLIHVLSRHFGLGAFQKYISHTISFVFL